MIEDLEQFPFGRVFGTPFTSKVCDILFVGEGLEYKIEDLSRVTGLDSSLLKIPLRNLVREKIIKKTRKGYVTNSDNPRTKALMQYMTATCVENVQNYAKGITK